MNFLQAIEAASICHPIRRTTWTKDYLHLDNGQLSWSVSKKYCNILGNDIVYDLQPDDLKATDWEIL